MITKIFIKLKRQNYIFFKDFKQAIKVSIPLFEPSPLEHFLLEPLLFDHFPF
jgi:hypothetical protein